MIFQGLSVARNCLRPETASFTIMDIKRRLLCNFAKNIKGRHFMGHSGFGFSVPIEFQIFKNSFDSLLKYMLKIPLMDLKKRGHFFKFCFSITF